MLLSAIQATISYTVRLIHNRTRAAAARLKLPLRCGVAPGHVRWLGLHAFVRVLGRKPAAYRLVLQVQFVLPYCMLLYCCIVYTGVSCVSHSACTVIEAHHPLPGHLAACWSFDLMLECVMCEDVKIDGVASLKACDVGNRCSMRGVAFWYSAPPTFAPACRCCGSSWLSRACTASHASWPKLWTTHGHLCLRRFCTEESC